MMWGTKKSACSAILIAMVLLATVPAACFNEKSRTYTVGVMNTLPMLDQILPGFKKGMREMGYIEGETIRYLYGGPITDVSKCSEAAQSLLAAKVDLILSISTSATRAVKQATAGTGLPMVFAVVTDPVGAGIVESMRQPGGNITGVASGIAEARRLEWLVRIAPDIRQIYVPFNAKGKAPLLALKMVHNAAAKLGVKLITREAHDPETLIDAVRNIPADADAVFLLPAGFGGTGLLDMVTTASKRNLPLSAPSIRGVEEHDILTSFGIDQHLVGKQAARLTDQIFKGARPADLPVETAEFYLAVNLKTAKTIGLAIPDEILRQAHLIVR
jgi:putative ABC transport system substrate-binding protein